MESNDIAISIEGVYKKFCRHLRRSMAYGTLDIARSMIGFRNNGRRLRPAEFWALEDVNLEVKQGETLGVMGENGSGKTTLLRLLSGVFTPDYGRIVIKGNVGALIAVGAGFHPHMTGRENIYLNGIILGMERKEIKQKFDEIVDFAEIDDFIDAPVSTYSSGMYVRLGFAIAIHSRPDILLADEILSVGDYMFQMKCYKKILDILKNGCTVVLVSHSDIAIRSVCKKMAIFRKGKLVETGNTDDMICKYRSILINDSIERKDQREQRTQRLSLFTEKVGLTTMGGMAIASIEIRDKNNELVRLNHQEFKKIPYSKQNKIYVAFDAEIFDTIYNPRIAFYVRDMARVELIYVCAATITRTNDERVAILSKGKKRFSCELDISRLAPGVYYVITGIGDEQFHIKVYDCLDETDYITFEIAFSNELVEADALINRPYYLSEYRFEMKELRQ